MGAHALRERGVIAVTTRESPGRRVKATGAPKDRLAAGSDVSLSDPADNLEQLRLDAAKWRALAACPHVAELIADWLEWHRRGECRASSNAISAACDWRKRSGVPTYAELARRRRTYRSPPLTPAQIRARAARSWAVIDGGKS